MKPPAETSQSVRRNKSADAETGLPPPVLCCGVAMTPVPLDVAAQAVIRSARRRDGRRYHLCNAVTLGLAVRQTAFARVLHHDRAVNLPDGVPVATVMRRRSARGASFLVRGPDLMRAVLAARESEELKHFFFGGSPDALDKLLTELARTYPRVRIAGAAVPPFRSPIPADAEAVARAATAQRADLVWVGWGTPRQDEFLSMLPAADGVVYVAVGAAFDFLGGSKREAPTILRGTGLEWMFRLLHEPRRLTGRYLQAAYWFCWGVFRDRYSD